MGVEVGINLTILVISGLLSYHEQRRARKEQERLRAEANVVDSRFSGSTQPINIPYGYFGMNTDIVYLREFNSFTRPPASSWGVVGSLSSGSSERRNTYLLTQSAIGIGELDRLIAVRVNNDENVPVDTYVHAWGYNESNAWGNIRADNDAADFTGLTFMNSIYFLDLDDRAYSGIPSTFVVGLGRRVPNITQNSDGDVVVDGTAFYNDTPSVLFDYLTNDSYGPGLSHDDIDLDNFYEAIQIARTVVRSNHRDINDEIYAPSLPNNLIRYEFNGVIPSTRNFPEAITRILATAPGSHFVRNHETGKYQIVLPTMHVLNRTFTRAQMLADPERQIPGFDRRLNRISGRFSNAEKYFADDEVIYPTANSVVHNQFAAEDDNRIFSTSIDLHGVNDRYHGNSIINNLILISRRENITVTLGPEAITLATGDKIRIQDEITGLDMLMRVFDIRTESRTNTTVEVTVQGIEYVESDYQWQPGDGETITTGITVSRELGVPSVAAVYDEDTRDIRVTLTPNSLESVEVDTYQYQFAKGTDWQGWVNAPAVNVLYDVPEGGGTFRFRARAASSTTGRRSPWSTPTPEITVTATQLADPSPGLKPEFIFAKTPPPAAPAQSPASGGVVGMGVAGGAAGTPVGQGYIDNYSASIIPTLTSYITGQITYTWFHNTLGDNNNLPASWMNELTIPGRFSGIRLRWVASQNAWLAQVWITRYNYVTQTRSSFDGRLVAQVQCNLQLTLPGDGGLNPDVVLNGLAPDVPRTFSSGFYSWYPTNQAELAAWANYISTARPSSPSITFEYSNLVEAENVTAAVMGNSVTISWDNPSNLPAGATANLGSGTAGFVVDVHATDITSPYTIGNLFWPTNYVFHLYYIINGMQHLSEDNALFIDTEGPEPQSVTATNIRHTSFQVVWTNPADLGAAVPTLQFTPIGEGQIISNNAISPTTVSNLRSGVSYRVHLYYLLGTARGANRNIDVTTTLPAPYNLQATRTTNTITLTWDDYDPANPGDLSGDGVRREIRYGNTYSSSSLVESDATSPYTITSLTPNTQYRYWVQNIRTNVGSDVSSITARTLASSTPTPTPILPDPTNVSVSSIGTTATISWDNPSLPSNTNVIVRQGTTILTNSGTSPYTASGLTVGQEYTFSVQYTRIGYDDSDEISVSITVGVPQPQNVRAVPQVNTVTLSWTLPAGIPSDAFISILQGPDEDTATTIATHVGGSPYTVSGLTADTAFVFWICLTAGNQRCQSIAVRTRTATVPTPSTPVPASLAAPFNGWTYDSRPVATRNAATDLYNRWYDNWPGTSEGDDVYTSFRVVPATIEVNGTVPDEEEYHWSPVSRASHIGQDGADGVDGTTTERIRARVNGTIIPANRPLDTWVAGPFPSQGRMAGNLVWFSGPLQPTSQAQNVYVVEREVPSSLNPGDTVPTTTRYLWGPPALEDTYVPGSIGSITIPLVMTISQASVILYNLGDTHTINISVAGGTLNTPATTSMTLARSTNTSALTYTLGIYSGPGTFSVVAGEVRQIPQAPNTFERRLTIIYTAADGVNATNQELYTLSA